MSSFKITISPFGPSALIIQWPAEVSEVILNDILNFQEYIKEQFKEGWDYISAYNSLVMVNVHHDFNFKKTKEKLFGLYDGKGEDALAQRFLWKLPVCYDEELAPDMVLLQQQLKLSKEEIVRLHTSHQYTVFAIGFLPGFMYLGGLPTALESTRRETPRLVVEKGSVGLAGKQTGIYPQVSPGGWNIIGKCPVDMFNLKAKDPCFVNVGDKVQFTPISKAEFDVHIIEAEVGILEPEKELLNA